MLYLYEIDMMLFLEKKKKIKMKASGKCTGVLKCNMYFTVSSKIKEDK